jgi:hypothetical protein
MEYPLKPGYYVKKENGKRLYVIAEEEGLVYCEQEGFKFAILAEVFVKRFEKVKD